MSKNILHKGVMLAVISMLSMACKKQLDQAPVSTLTEDNYYKTTDEVETGVIGIYNGLLPLYNDNYIVVDLRSDDAYVSETDGDQNQIDGFIEGPTNSYLEEYWRESYYVIKQANTVLKYINNVTDSNKKNWFQGEAEFLRASMYFNLVRLWGDVPLVTTDIAYNDVASFRRVSKDSVYMQIVADMKDAAAKLPQSWVAGKNARVTSYAAKGMLGKVYLTLKDYPDARAVLQDLVTNPGTFALRNSFADVFGLGNEMNSEILFTVRYTSNANGLGEIYTYNMADNTGSQNVKVGDALRLGFAKTDTVRKNTSIVVYAKGNYNGCGKFLDPSAPIKDAGCDFIVLRLADVILMYAEVINEMDGPTAQAVTELNLIRARAGISQYTTTSFANATAFRNAIKSERLFELSYEAQRWFDLLRWGDALSAMSTEFSKQGRDVSAIQAFHLLYPIPQHEIDVSAGVMTQNPGY